MADDYNELSRENERLKKQVTQLETELATYKVNGGIGLYYELNRMVNLTVEFLRKKTSIESLMGTGEDSAKDKTFERTMTMMKNAKENLKDLVEIKATLNLSGNEEKDKAAIPFIEQIAETRR